MNRAPGASTTIDHPVDERLATLLDEYLVSLEAGAPLDIDALAAAHPALAADIREFARSIEQLHRAAQGAATPEDATRGPSVASPESRLGDYRIVRELGRGGMGVVYEAEQISLTRRVALKVLPFAAMWDRKQLTRFQNEARAAAQLHHPHIVPVFGVGQERGVHFYAMQLVQGQSLDRLILELRRAAALRSAETAGPGGTTAPAADSSPNSVLSSTQLGAARRGCVRDYCRAVAELGAQAADALQYAHDCGVIHRDVKPSNLLLDERNRVWITDFGLARIQGDPGVTATGDVVGTLRYMSPEQAAGHQALVDARTDVYSLGATLYELLALEPAFPGDDRREVTQAVIAREPRRLRELAAETPIDLETVVMHALAKSREDRYATAGELAADLRRFLASKPTHARRPTLVDRASKLVRRHRVAATALGGFVAVVAVLSTTGAVLLSSEQARTAAALADAQASLDQARRVVDRFGGQFVRELERLPGSEPLRRAVLADTLEYYRNFIAQAVSDSQLTAELATTQYQAGMVAGRLGDFDAAEQYLRAASEAFGQLADQGDEAGDYRQQQAACWNSLGLLYAEHGDNEQAGRCYTRAAALQEALVRNAPADAASHRQLAQILANRGLLSRRQGDDAAAQADLAAAIETLERVVAGDPELADAKYDLALALNNHSFVQQPGDFAAARRSCERAIAVLSELVDSAAGESAAVSTYQADLALCLNNLGAIQGHLDDGAAAVVSLRDAAAIQETLMRQAPAVVQHRSDLAVTLNNLGQAETRSGAPQRAREAFERAIALLDELVRDYPAETRFASALAGVLNNQAMADEAAGDWAAAIGRYEAAIARQRTAWSESGQRRQFHDYLSKHYANYVRCLRAAGRSGDAAAALIEQRELWQGDGPALYAMALAMAEAADELAGGEDGNRARDAILAEAATTLTAAIEAWSAADGPLPRDALPAAVRTRLDAKLLAKLGEQS
ncbi:MAG: serine/threonine protein kinase [Planctomycetales bacterium]|nr:serine/threonine protein kinase [Planctomycetales bacterium]